MKIALIESMMPELKGQYIYKTGRGEASNTDAAVSRAFKDLRKQLKGKRASIFKCTITITEKADAAGNVVECGCSGKGICTVCGKDGADNERN
jgi:hypothetical protein